MAKSGKRKVRKNIAKAIVHIKATFNNTIITFTDPDGAAICSGSAGCVGFKGSRKSTPFAAQQAAQLESQLYRRCRARDFVSLRSKI